MAVDPKNSDIVYASTPAPACIERRMEQRSIFDYVRADNDIRWWLAGYDVLHSAVWLAGHWGLLR
jgi:hypothetical protein